MDKIERSNNFRVRISDLRGDLVGANNPLPVADLLWQIRRGEMDNAGIVQKFGGRFSIGASYAPATTSGVYQTPQVGSATALRIKAGGNANDTAAGSGARAVTIQGLDQTGAFAEAVLTTAGASASAASSTTFIRQFRQWVSASGTYATAAAGSHAAAIVLESTGGTEWSSIDATDYPKGQSQIACYTVPLGRVAYMSSVSLTMNANKPVDFLLLKRENILETAVPYSAMRTVTELIGLQDPFRLDPDTAIGPFPALTDIIWMAQGAQTPSIMIDFEIIEFYD